MGEFVSNQRMVNAAMSDDSQNGPSVYTVLHVVVKQMLTLYVMQETERKEEKKLQIYECIICDAEMVNVH